MSIFNRSILQSIAMLAFAGLTACETGPQYRTDTSYVAPTTTQGATCVATCQTNEQVCRARQEDTARAEYTGCMQRANNSYKICMQGEMTMSCQNTRDTDERICDRNSKPYYQTCVSSYNACYQTCGGEVLKNTVCVKNCE